MSRFIIAYVFLILLFRCLHLLEMEERRRRCRGQYQRLKHGVWATRHRRLR